MIIREQFCKQCGKKLISPYSISFCCKSCAAKYNNANRKITTKGKKKLVECILCGEKFWASIHISTKQCKCEKCKKHNRPHAIDITNSNSILDVSKRTAVLLFERANRGCSICGWNEARCDIHHIIPRSKGGSNDNSNLVYLCPNCHRVVHTTNNYSREYLRSLSVHNTFSNWKKYYHTSN